MRTEEDEQALETEGAHETDQEQRSAGHGGGGLEPQNKADPRWWEAILESATTAIEYLRVLGEFELELRLEADEMERVWRTEFIWDGWLWVWSRDAAPGSEFVLECVFDHNGLLPFAPPSKIHALFKRTQQTFGKVESA